MKAREREFMGMAKSFEALHTLAVAIATSDNRTEPEQRGIAELACMLSRLPREDSLLANPTRKHRLVSR